MLMLKCNPRDLHANRKDNEKRITPPPFSPKYATHGKFREQPEIACKQSESLQLNRKRSRIFYMSREELKNTLRQFIEKDPYIAFFIEFFADIGIEELFGNHVKNPATNTRITASPVMNKIIIEQDGKRISIPISTARQIVEELYGRIPFSLIY